MKLISDEDVWASIPPEYLWVTDKLILARRLDYLCGPAGVSVPKPDNYVVRPCVNYRMMGLGARMQFLIPGEQIETGSFWCEVFKGRHLSFDYNYGKQVLAVEGFRDGPRLDRFSKWVKVKDKFDLPPLLKEIALNVEWFNVECIGDKVIECHFRYNDDFANHNADEIVPVWKDEFYTSPAGDRIGFILKHKQKENEPRK